MAKVTIADLQAQIDALTAERDGLVARAGRAEGDLATVTAQRDDHAGKVKELAAAVDAKDGEIRALGGSLRAFKSSATRARNEALVLKRDKSPEARPIGEIGFRVGKDGNWDDAGRARHRAAFQDALREGPIELVFSDGKREIRELAPLAVAGDAWREDARGFTLKFEPLLEPGEMARPEVTIVGVAALNEAGEQLAWQRWVEPVSVPRNGRVQLTAGHIRFAF